MSKYIYQKFLLNCEYEKINLSDYPITTKNLMEVPNFGEDYCIFDIGKEIVRKISLSTMDETIDTEDDWNNFEKKLENIDLLIITGISKKYNNPIVQAYRVATVKAYLFRFSMLSIKVEIC
ncbi:hypothetical protein SAMN05216249_10498 [Acetitomaculum ruminis DSM 5522]|uniref:Uncharacterized protein n=1 Tax=Acetitomaculum ruminis DSM 5522 TaxID=1120918 RepID=A0A1I0WI59_9FIRM|nr:hypothetical protein [Acetitomaculum ruminis]SFA88432.1 hypothetical protein SAMN05216249_10498 [Acetitomaculum ruminis DSM 5522]